jgi:hypothetical protein
VTAPAKNACLNLLDKE